MNTQLVHALNDYVELRHNGTLLFRYTYVPTFDPWESRKPFMCPIYTLSGREITVYRPHDHVWHKGIQMTMACLSGQNFWGGYSWVREKKIYEKLDNVGSMKHIAWDELTCDEDRIVLRERLKWITQAGAGWINEVRELRVDLKPDEGFWSLNWAMRLSNMSGQMLRFGSPTTEGHINAGYGGLFWRGPRSFTGGKILGTGNIEGPEAMGQRSPWLACRHARWNSRSIDDPVRRSTGESQLSAKVVHALERVCVYLNKLQL